jgi:serine/threonine protein kinase
MGHASRALGGSMLTKSVGTRLYASPEQLECSNYDYKSDIYSLAIVLQRLFNPTYTHMETIKMIEQVRNGTIRESFMDYYDLMGATLKKAVDKDPKQRPELEAIEKCMAAQCIKLFRELRYDHSSANSAIFKNLQDNPLAVGTTMSLFEVNLAIEGEAGHRVATLLVWHGEVLPFFEGESKSKLSFNIKDYTLITHKKRKIIGLKCSLKSDLTLMFQSLDDLDMFLLYAMDQGCLIY